MYEKRYQEGYDVPDPKYEAWLKITHPIETSSVVVCRSTTPAGACFTETSSASSAFKSTGLAGSSNSVLSGSKCSDILEEFLVLPKPKPTTTRKTKKGLNSKAICITEDEVLKELKEREAERLAKQEEKERKRLEKEEKGSDHWIRKRKQTYAGKGQKQRETQNNHTNPHRADGKWNWRMLSKIYQLRVFPAVRS